MILNLDTRKLDLVHVRYQIKYINKQTFNYDVEIVSGFTLTNNGFAVVKGYRL